MMTLALVLAAGGNLSWLCAFVVVEFSPCTGLCILLEWMVSGLWIGTVQLESSCFSFLGAGKKGCLYVCDFECRTKCHRRLRSIAW